MKTINAEYVEPVASLLERGEIGAFDGWDNYLGLGFTKEHVADLIKMATDSELHQARSDTTEVWAPVHAWRALGQLRAEQAIVPLVKIFWRADDDDWAGEDLFQVMGMIGPACIPYMVKYIAKKLNGYAGRSLAAHSLFAVALEYPDHRADCIEALAVQLGKNLVNDVELNGSIVSFLVDLGAVETIDIIEEAYEMDCVDDSVCGDFEDVEIALGLKFERENEPDYKFYWSKEVPEELFDENQQVRPGSVAKHDPLTSLQQQMPLNKSKKIGRNEPCPCGSGKKYKKCCLP